MKTLIALILLSSVSIANAVEPPKTTVQTNDSRVIYSQTDNKLISVQKQTVCTQVNGKQQCHDRAVATMIPK